MVSGDFERSKKKKKASDQIDLLASFSLRLTLDTGSQQISFLGSLTPLNKCISYTKTKAKVSFERGLNTKNSLKIESLYQATNNSKKKSVDSSNH